MIYKFVEKPADMEVIKGSRAYRMYQKLEEVGYRNLTKSEKEELNSVFNELWHSETYKTGKYKIRGWIIDFTKWLKTYWVEDKYNGIREIKSFNKTFIRKNATTPSHILKVVEIN